jgi:HAD superfamily hydrolase (TIGR01509 family)
VSERSAAGPSGPAAQPPRAAKKRLRALVFDFDGLILDTEWPAYSTAAEVWSDHGLELELAAWQEILGTADHPHWTDMLEQALGRPVDREALVPPRLARHHALIEAEELLPGVVDLIEAAHAAGIGLAVASSSPLDWVDDHLERRGLRARFDAVVTRDHVERTKPAPDLFRRAVAELGVHPGEAVALEDSRHGVDAARAAGLACVAVPNRITRLQDLTAADLVVDSLAEVTLADLEDLV